MRSSVSASPAPGRQSASAAPSAGPSRGGRAASQSANQPQVNDGSGGFSQRNLYYLRSSPYTVLQMVLYLDARHVAWMNAPSEEANGLRANGEVIMQKALAVLRTRIMDKLRKESGSNGRMGVVSRKEKVDVYASYDFQMAYFFRKMSDRHAVLLKEKSLMFPHSSEAMPLTSETEAGNDPIPSSSERAAKRRRTDVEDTSGLFLGDGAQAGIAEEEVVAAKPEEEDDEAAAALLQNSAGVDVNTNEGFYDPMQDDYFQSAEEIAEQEQGLKPRLRYSGFRIFGKMLVVVIEPSKSVIADNPDLFGAAPPTEVRQLSVTPMPGGPAGRASSRARTQSRLTSVRGPSSTPGPSASRNTREGSRRDSRAPSPGIGATLFLGSTPTPTPEPESRRFGSRGVSRAMSATPGPGGHEDPPRTRDPEVRSNALVDAINQRSTQNIRKLPPVPRFFDNEEMQGGGGGAAVIASTSERHSSRQSQAPSPTPEAAQETRPRASSILPRQARPSDDEPIFGDDDDSTLPALGTTFDFGDPEEHQLGDGDDDDDDPPTGLALATQMMEAGGQREQNE
ncbi:hypothetical protein A4X06_0g3031 [Tilletia controversa]|uniref:Uncharacterized protein n=1 Tax=Tilletia controversa TaxID=13291 RepID=A0A8X7SXW0_9BASI|nr:hypothetical protein CF328_g2392 [Tilletia controversa]KAE8249871.1 hypothetical protein A4X06_0g3031 [Tilletia controversa]